MALKTVDPRFSVYVGNLSNSVTLSDMEELLYELFLQVKQLKILYNFLHIYVDGWSKITSV